jgi:hypothetical protein
MYTVSDYDKPAVGGEASLQQTSFTVPTDGKGDTNIPVYRRRMETEKAKVWDYIQFLKVLN